MQVGHIETAGLLLCSLAFDNLNDFKEFSCDGKIHYVTLVHQNKTCNFPH